MLPNFNIASMPTQQISDFKLKFKIKGMAHEGDGSKALGDPR